MLLETVSVFCTIGLMNVAQLTLNGIKIHYSIAGVGPAALLVHGHASSKAIWARIVADYLGRHYRCYLLDLPGHSESDKPLASWFTLENYTQLLRAFCAHFELNNILLMAHSMGGLLGLNLALTQPGLVERLILVAPVVDGDFVAYLDPLLLWEKWMPQPWAEYALNFYNANLWFAAPIGLNWYAHPRMILSASFRQAQADFARCPVSTLLGNLRVIRQAHLSHHLPMLSTPALVITGALDRVVPPSQANMVAAGAHAARLATIPQCGHLPFDEQPDRFDEAVKAYLQIK
jgi:pimeloyl-ACP methyl ester carboxylesterase